MIGKTTFRLASVQVNDEKNPVVQLIRYDVQHHDDKTVLEFEVHLRRVLRDGTCSANVVFDGIQEASPQRAMATLSAWCQRAAHGLNRIAAQAGSLPHSHLPLQDGPFVSLEGPISFSLKGPANVISGSNYEQA